MTCLLCKGELQRFYAPDTSFSVSSDCRVIEGFPIIYRCTSCGHIQKKYSESYQRIVEEIYADYTASCLTGEHEQLQFEAGIPASRTQLILDNVADYLPEPLATWLDVGTGGGVMLNTLSNTLPDVKLWGQDVSAHNQVQIESIANVNGLFSGELSSIKQQFNVISVIHVLEHVTDLESFLSEIARMLTPNGVLLIQVPNVTENPFDLCVFDHVSHFQPKQLCAFLAEYFPFVAMPCQQLSKEITVLAGHQSFEKVNSTASSSSTNKIDLENLSALNNLLATIQSSTAVFSSGPAGIYAAGNLGDNLSCIVDEDANKIGKHYLGVPIVSPENLSAEQDTINPLPKAQRQLISEKYPDLKFVEY